MINLNIQVELDSKCRFFSSSRKKRKVVSYSSLLDERQKPAVKKLPRTGKNLS